MLKRRTVRVGEIQFVQHINISPQVAAGITERQGKGEKQKERSFPSKKYILYVFKAFCVPSLGDAPPNSQLLKENIKIREKQST